MITNLPDTCIIADVVEDGYGDRTLDTLTEVDCLFNHGNGYGHANGVDYPVSDANVYFDIENEVVISKGYSLKGMYVMCNSLGGSEEDSWYRISNVEIGQQKLTTNAVDNVHAFLTKVAKPE